MFFYNKINVFKINVLFKKKLDYIYMLLIKINNK